MGIGGLARLPVQVTAVTRQRREERVGWGERRGREETSERVEGGAGGCWCGLIRSRRG